MSVMGLCHICGAPSNAVCKNCGRPMCPNHTDQKTGVCTVCSTKMPPGKGRFPEKGPDDIGTFR